jgi:hypothetical protein
MLFDRTKPTPLTPPTPPPDQVVALRSEVAELKRTVTRIETRLVRLMEEHGLTKQGTRLKPEEFAG